MESKEKEEEFFKKIWFFDIGNNRNKQTGSAKLPVFLVVGLVVVLAILLLLLPYNRGNNNTSKVSNEPPEGLVTVPAVKGELPEDFPKELVLYSYADILHGEDTTYKSLNQKIAVFSVPDSPEAVYEFYKSNLPKTGWLLVNESPGEEVIVLTFQKEDKEFEVLITPQSQGSQVRLDYMSPVK